MRQKLVCVALDTMPKDDRLANFFSSQTKRRPLFPDHLFPDATLTSRENVGGRCFYYYHNRHLCVPWLRKKNFATTTTTERQQGNFRSTNWPEGEKGKKKFLLCDGILRHERRKTHITHASKKTFRVQICAC